MIRFLFIAGGVGILSFIYFRRYLVVEKGMTMSSLLFRKRNLFRHVPDTKNSELTLDEIIPSKEEVDKKKLVQGDSLLKKAEIQLNRGDLVGAEKFLIEALSLDPSCVGAYKHLGMIYLRQEQYGKAEGIYRKLTATITDDPCYFSNLGMALFSQRKMGDAKKFYKRAIELDDTRAGRYFSLGQILFEMDEQEDALDNFKKAAEMDPKNLDYSLTLAHFYSDKEMVDQAKGLLEDILQAFPDCEDAQKMMEKVG